MSGENETLEAEVEAEPVEAILDEDGLVKILDERKTEIYNKGYYGCFEKGVLKLTPLEALLLLERGRIKVTDSDKNPIDFKQLVNFYLKKDQKIWTKYIVYRDLRSRGYTVGLGYEGEMDFRVYERGAVPNEDAAKYLVYVIEEGIPLALINLEKIISIGASSRKKTALAVVDRQGEPTYYFVSEVEL
ncbi:MAG: tRNA-intron lyase [Candidatus Odinarchaeum yellowstonii]|uniref:tRNA-intron lyase n=1 Tax=Odinarchaeota yellowstonii (strain LCB_4) TaxID=1841599 RepID=A0AAF0IC45_ODILC|nr:MAG: tRNA-intron lyase [Candidatus Odinarchaeum yellowstonii]